MTGTEPHLGRGATAEGGGASPAGPGPGALEFWFDFSSPYAFLASHRIEALAARHGRAVDWRPMLLGAAFKVAGTAPLTDVPMKGDYSRRDFVRSARFHGIEGFRMP
ncbi:MAG TPA: DsbA family protein, partial [Casimicrobiaceae bacterium]|nr:DsbA family protein [Casimicrobiaceae bacterium]